MGHQQPRRPGDQVFTKIEAQRLIRSAQQAGLKKFRIEVHRNCLTLIVGEQDEVTTETNNEWDEDKEKVD
jgi:hypothetical protein